MLESLSYSLLVFDQVSFWYYLRYKRNKRKLNFYYEAMPMMTSQILKSVDNETKSGEWNIYSLNKKFN